MGEEIQKWLYAFCPHSWGWLGANMAIEASFPWLQWGSRGLGEEKRPCTSYTPLAILREPVTWAKQPERSQESGLSYLWQTRLWRAQYLCTHQKAQQTVVGHRLLPAETKRQQLPSHLSIKGQVHTRHCSWQCQLGEWFFSWCFYTSKSSSADAVIRAHKCFCSHRLFCSPNRYNIYWHKLCLH